MRSWGRPDLMRTSRSTRPRDMRPKVRPAINPAKITNPTIATTYSENFVPQHGTFDDISLSTLVPTDLLIHYLYFSLFSSLVLLFFFILNFPILLVSSIRSKMNRPKSRFTECLDVLSPRQLLLAAFNTGKREYGRIISVFYYSERCT